MQLKFNHSFASDVMPRHDCNSRREGNWFVFTCPLCPGYERRFNYATGQLITKPGADPYVLHQAQFAASPLDTLDQNLN